MIEEKDNIDGNVNAEDFKEENNQFQAGNNAQPEDDTQEDDGFQWYAVRIISGHENKVKSHMDSEIRTEGYDDRIRNVAIPLEKVFEVKNGKKKIRYKNFYPGYILIEAKIDNEIRNFIANTPSIISMVGNTVTRKVQVDSKSSGKKTKDIKVQEFRPIPLRGEEVKRIKAILSDDSQEEKIDFHLNVGDPVKVTNGPFNNFSGNVIEVNLEKMKVKVMVSIFGRKTPIELEFTQIEREK